MFHGLGFADESKRKTQGNDPCRNKSGAQGFKIYNEEQSVLNNLKSFDLRNEDSKSSASVPSTSKKQKLHWGYSSNSTFIKRKMHF